MGTLTATQRTDMQGDLGITSDETVFTNDELDRLYTRAGDDYERAVYLAWRQIKASVAKFYSYTVGHTKVDRQQIWDHVVAMVEDYEKTSKSGSEQVIIAGINDIPTRHKDSPGTTGERLSIKQLNRGL